MKVKSIKRILILFFISFFCVLFNPHISFNVMATQTSVSESYNFEASTLTQQVTLLESGGWMITETNEANAYVSDVQAWGSGKSYEIQYLYQETFWNYTYDEASYLFNWTVGIRTGVGLVNHLAYWNFYDDNDTDPIIRFKLDNIDANQYSMYFYSATEAGWVMFTSVAPDQPVQNVWYNVSWNMNDNDNVTYFHMYNDSQKMGSPAKVITDPRIDSVLFYCDTDTDTMWFDNHSIIVDTILPDDYTGDMTINIFNESNVSQAITNYNIYVLNKIGGIIYNLSGQSNPTVINTSDFGIGYRYFLLEHDDYSSRMFGFTVELGVNYSLNALLAPINDSLLYYVKVIDQLESPIYNVSIVIVKTVGGTIYNIASLLTDTWGYAGLYLLGGETYWVNVSKEGYNSINGARWDTDPDNYGIDNPKIFQLSISTGEDIVYYDFFTHIVFTGEMQDNNSILITYKDKLSLTDDTQIRTFETYNGTDTLVNITNTTDNNNFNFYIEGINATRIHYADLYFNHSYNFTADQPVRIFIYPINYTSIPHTNATNLEDALTNVFGVNPLGWGNSIAVAIALMLLVSFGPYNAPMGVICCGLGLAIPKLAFAINNPYLLALIPVIVIIGIIYVIIKNPEVNI